MKTLLILLMPVMIVTFFIASNKFFAASDYYTSAVFTLAWLCSVTVWITAITSRKLALR